MKRAGVIFKAVAYDDHGQRIGEVKAEWTLAGPLPPVFPIGFPNPPKTTAMMAMIVYGRPI